MMIAASVAVATVAMTMTAVSTEPRGRNVVSTKQMTAKKRYSDCFLCIMVSPPPRNDALWRGRANRCFSR